DWYDPDYYQVSPKKDPRDRARARPGRTPCEAVPGTTPALLAALLTATPCRLPCTRASSVSGWCSPLNNKWAEEGHAMFPRGYLRSASFGKGIHASVRLSRRAPSDRIRS